MDKQQPDFLSKIQTVPIKSPTNLMQAQVTNIYQTPTSKQHHTMFRARQRRNNSAVQNKGNKI